MIAKNRCCQIALTPTRSTSVIWHEAKELGTTGASLARGLTLIGNSVDVLLSPTCLTQEAQIYTVYSTPTRLNPIFA